jgi:AraC-like DNA-binding protein
MRFLRPKGLLAGFAVMDKDDPRGILKEAGEEWTARDYHIHPHANAGWELFYQTKGGSDWRQGCHQFHVPAGGYYLIAPHARHALVRFHGEEIHFFFAVFDPVRLGHACTKQWPRPYSAGPGAHTLEIPFRGLIRELILDDPAKSAGIRHYLGALCLEIDRLLTSSPGMEPDLAAHPASLRARELMHAHPETVWRLDELAALCGISIPHLTEVFRRDFGQTPWQYLMRYRIELAAGLLATSNRPITEIALDFGFSSSQHFANTFRKLRGRSPSQERRLHHRKRVSAS